jgi:ribonuclease HI
MTTRTDVFTDGSKTGTTVDVAGAGVWVPSTRQAFASNVPGLQTNNRAELCAVILALMMVDGPLRIFCDSMYTIDSLTTWYKSWQKNNWKSSSGPVKNPELIRAALNEMEGRDIEFIHVRGHQKDQSYPSINNNIVDSICITQTGSEHPPGIDIEEMDFPQDAFDGMNSPDCLKKQWKVTSVKTKWSS